MQEGNRLLAVIYKVYESIRQAETYVDMYFKLDIYSSWKSVTNLKSETNDN